MTPPRQSNRQCNVCAHNFSDECSIFLKHFTVKYKRNTNEITYFLLCFAQLANTARKSTSTKCTTLHARIEAPGFDRTSMGTVSRSCCERSRRRVRRASTSRKKYCTTLYVPLLRTCPSTTRVMAALQNKSQKRDSQACRKATAPCPNQVLVCTLLGKG